MKKTLLSLTLALFVALSLFFSTNGNSQSIEAGNYFTLMLCDSNSTPKAMGDNGYGQLGDGTYSQQTNPVLVSGIANVIAISGGGYHSLALKSDGTVWAWGYNWYGELGDGTNSDKITPVQVSGLTGIVAISAGESHSLALKSDGTVWAWGYNSYGQLGDGTNTDRTTPVQISGLTGVTNISAGRYHSLARKSNGTAWAWGYNGYGQLGDGTTTNRNAPVQVLTISGITSVSGGRYHSLARKSDGTIWSWGYNGYGQLGDGTTTQRTSPVQVSGLTGMTNAVAGYYHSLAIKSDGTAWAWGRNWEGQLGDGTTNQSTTPVQVSGLTGITVISGGYYHSVAAKSNGTFWAWGANWNGQLGDGTYNSTTTPIQIHDCCSNLPSIALSDTCLKMDTTVVGGVSQKTFLIFNSACDTLKVTSITSNNAVFTVSPSSLYIPSYSSAIFTVTFSPVALGNSAGTLTIYNNDKDTTVCLSGYCIPAPTMTHSPSLFNISLGCNDSSTSVLNIGNTGAGILNYNITTSASSSGAKFFDDFESGNISSWNIGSGTYTRTVVTTNPASGTYCLQLNAASVSGYDGLNHTFPSNAASYISFKIKSGDGGSSSCNVEIGRASDITSNGSLAQIWMDNGALQLYMWSPSTGSIPTPMVIGQWYQVEFRNINYSTKTFDYYVNGTLISSGVSFWNSSITSVDVIHLYSWNNNSISYFDDIAIGTDPNSWLSYSPTIGTVNSSGSQNVNVKFNSANIVAGTYYGNLVLHSNDPANLQVAVPCTLTVAGSPKIALNKTCLNYGSLMVGATAKDSVMITNTGCDTLKANSIVSSSSVFTVNPTSGNLPPGQSGYVRVTFTPVAVTSYSATLTFYSNVNDTTICLTGAGTPAPTIVATPASFNVSVACGDTLKDTLYISNTGAANLIFSTGGNTLDTVLSKLNQNYSSITALIPSMYNFSIDGFPNYINDGGNDMYDGGNYISTNLGSGLSYSDNLVINSAAMGVGGKYFTRKYNGLWVFAADINNISYFEITGNNGADGSGNMDATVLTVMKNGTTFKGFVKRVYNAWDPSINHLIIVEDKPGINHNYSTNTDNDQHQITSLNSNQRIYDLLYAGSNGGYINNAQTLAIMNQFLDAINAGASWLTVGPPNGDTLTPSTSTAIPLQFNASGLSVGQYNSAVTLSSNDPANPIVSVPITLTVTGSPKILLDKTCLNYGSLMVGATIKDSVMITNTGCDTLKASSIVATPSVFTVTPASGNLLPGQSGYVKVTFAPVAVTSYTGTITFQGNINDTTVCLTGTGLPAPTISTTPTSFTVTINSCNDSVTSPLTINNTGAADLNFTISNFNAIPVSTCTVTTTASCCSYGINNVQFNTINNASANASAGYQDFTSINTVVQRNKTYQLNVQTGYSWEYVNAWVDWNNNGVFESGENVMNNISGSQPHSTSVTVPANAVQNTALRMRVVSDDNWNPQACSNVNYGQHEDYTLIVDNWLFASPLTGTVTPSGSTMVNVKSKSTGLISGQYTSSIVINSNDPANPMVTIPCTLTVVGSPKIVLSKTCMYLDSIMTYSTKKDSLYIKNTGCDTLKISSITKQTANFSVTPTSGNVVPGDSIKGYVTFIPTTAGTFYDTLTFLNNDVTKKICLSGKAYPRPIISESPGSFSAPLTCVDSLRDTLIINNTGGSNLNYNINILNPTMSSSLPIAASCSPPGSQNTCCNMGIVNVTLNSINNTTSISDGEYHDYTATQKTILVPGQTYTLSVQSGNSYNEYAEAWIDYNNNGIFESGENIMNNSNSLPSTIHTVTFTVPFSAAKNKSVRMRVVSNYYWDGVPQPCNNVFYGQFEDYTIQLLGWVALSSSSGTVVPGSSDTVTVTFNSNGLSVGTYTATISTDNNDPLNNPRNISATLNVTGTGKIALSKNCMYLDSIMQFTSQKDSFYIKNTGCDTLKITNITKQTSIFSVNPVSVNILTGDSAKLIVTYSPTSYPGLFYDTLTILNNDVTKQVCLSGKAYQRPIQCHTPNSFNVSLSCCDSITKSLKVCNSGGSNLIFNIQGGGGAAKPKVLIITAGDAGTNAKTALVSTGKFTASDIDVLISPSPLTMAMLAPYDAVLVWTNSSFGSSMVGDTLKKFVDNGGGVVIGTYGFHTSWGMSGGIMGSNYTPFVPSGSTQCVSGTINLAALPYPTHPIFKNISINPTYWTNCNYYNPALNAGATLLATDMSGNKVVAENYNGKVVGMVIFPENLNSANASTDLMFANALYYVNNNTSWLTVNPTADTVTTAAGDTSVINLKFKSCGILAGAYNTTLILSSNDPLNLKDTILVTFNVVGVGKISLATNCLYLDSIMEYTTHKDSLYIKNTGCDTLKVTNITKQTSTYSISSTAMNILIGDSAKLVVTFAPASTGIFYDTLTISNNDTTRKICLSGKAFPKPVQCHSPNSFNVHFTICQDSITDTLHVCNTGGSNLNYSLWAPDGRSASFNGGGYINRNATNNLPTGSIMTAEAWIYPTSYSDWNYNGIVSWGGRWCNGNAMVLSIQSNGRPSMATWCWDFVPGSGPTAILNQWNHIACVLNGNSVTLYMNGVPISGTLGGVPNVQTNNLSIGSTDYPGRNFNGKIDEVRIYNRALSQSEILAGMHNTLTGTESGLKGYWNFDDGTANDLTANGNNGTLNGGVSITTPNAQFIPASTGTVTPSNTTSIPVKFKKVGLSYGTHILPIYLNSNDPLNTLDTINISMIIDSLPPTPPVAKDTNVCFGNPTPPLISTANPGDTIRWYDDAALTSLVYTGNSFVSTQTAIGTYTYYVTSTDSISGCVSLSDTVLLHINVAPGKPTATDAAACFGAAIPNLSSTGTLLKWYSNSSLTTLVHTGNKFTTGQTAVGTYTYYVADSTGGCPKSVSDTAMLTIHPLPAKPIANDTAACFGGLIPSLVASVTGNDTIKWYNSSMTYVNTGSPYNTGQTAAGTYTYYVTSSDTVTGCASVKDTAHLTINFTATPVAGNVNVCFGNSAMLTATGTNIQWYDSTLTFASAGASYNTGLTSVHTYTYYTTQTLNGCESSMKMITLTINPIPLVPTAPDKQSCFGQATPALTATGTNIKWYNNATLLTLVHSGSPYNTGLTTAGTYTYYVTQTAVGCASPSDTVYLIIHSLPSTPVATNTFVCFGNPTPDLLATGTTGNDTVHWYANASLTPIIYTGNPYTTGQTAAGTYTYYVTQTDSVTGCRSKSDTVTLSINASPLEPTANDPTICFGSLTPSLIASGTNLQWFDNPSLTPVVGVGPFTPAVTAVGSYTFFVTDSVPGCPQSPADTATLTINPIPSVPVSVPQKDSICFGQANPSFSAAGANIQWWSNPSTTTLISSGSPLTPTVTAAATYTYYVTQSALGCKSPSDTVLFKINPLPVVNFGSDVTQCGGTVTLNAGNSGATYLWSDNSTAQTLLVSISGTYSVLVTNAGGCTMTDTINITINPVPAPPVSVPQKDSICFGQANPSFSAAGTNIEWWSNPSTTTLLSSGSPFTPTVTVAGTYTYYVTQSSLGCKSISDTATFIIHFTPKLAVNDTAVSFGSPAVSLSATGSNIQWYDTSGTMVNAGSPFNTGLTAIGSYTYFVTQTLFGCEGVNDTVIVIILPGAPTSASQTVCFGQTVPDMTATGANIKWYSNASLTILAGTGSPFATGQTAAGTYTYYVTQTVNNVQSPDTMVTLTINALPATLTASNQKACVGGTIPDMTVAGINIQWYDTSGAMVFAGNPFATGQTAVGTYTYMATQTNTVTGCESLQDTVTLSINALPVPPVACNDTVICFGDPIPNLSAAGANITWYDGLGNFVTTGSPFPPAVSAPGIYTFLATQTNTLTTCESAGDTVRLTINSTAPPVAPDVAVCFGNPVPPLVVTGTNIQWYDVSMSLVATNDTLVTGQTAAGTYTYYVTQTNTVTTCASQKDTVYLIISTQPTAAPIIADQTSCAGSAIADLISSTGTIINWYSDAALTNHVYTGNPFATGQVTPGIYTFFAIDSTPGCPPGPSDTAILTINPQPATPVVNDTATCFGSANLALIFIGTNVQWYDTSLALVFSGDTFTSGQTAAGTYTYYVTQTNTVTTCSSKADTVMLTIRTLPAVPGALDTMVCSAAPIPNLTASGTNVLWYDTSGAFVFSGNSYATGQTTSGIHNYYATQTDAVTGCESVRDTATLTIILSPSAPAVNNVTVCTGNPVPAFTSTGTNSKWYNDAALSTLVHTGNSFSTGYTISGVYTYYITDSLTGCVSSAADSATLTIYPTPAKPTANNVTVCYGGSSVLSTTGNNPQWYSDATLINKIGAGNNFNTGKTAVGVYTYYVTLSDSVTGCASVEDTALLTINPTPLVTANTYSATILQNSSTTLTAYNAVTYSWVPSAGLSSSTGATVVASPTSNTTYTITGTNAYGCSNSVTIDVVVNPLGVLMLNNPLQDVTIYPNPAIDRFTLEFNTTLESPIKIYLLNMLGEEISVIQDAGMQGTGWMQHKYVVSTNDLAEGVYHIQIVTEQGTVNRRMVLLR